MNNEKTNSNTNGNTDKKLKRISKHLKYSVIIMIISIIVVIVAIIVYTNKDFEKNTINALFAPNAENINMPPEKSENIKISASKSGNETMSSPEKVEKPISNVNTNENPSYKKVSDEAKIEQTTTINPKPNSETIKTKDLATWNTNKLYSTLIQGSDSWGIYATFLENFSKDQKLLSLLKDLKSTGVQKIPTTYDLISSFDNVYMEVDLHCLKTQSTLMNDIKYLFAKLIYIRKTTSHSQINNSYCLNNIQEIQDALLNNQLSTAYKLFINYKLSINQVTSSWGKKLEARIITDNILDYLNSFIGNIN